MDYWWSLAASFLAVLVFLWGFGLVFAAVTNRGNPWPYFYWTGGLVRRFFGWLPGLTSRLLRWIADAIAWVVMYILDIVIHYPWHMFWLLIGAAAGLATGYHLWHP